MYRFSQFVVTTTLFFSATAWASFSKEHIRTHIQTLASVEFAGRAPMTDGELKTGAYLQTQFAALGLEPLPGWEGYAHPVPLAAIDAKAQGTISFGELTLDQENDIAWHSNLVSKDFNLSGNEVVFVGYGIVSERWGWNDYAGVDVRGKVVITLVNDPGYATGNPELFDGKDLTYFGRWMYKFEEARRQGARAAFVIHEDDAAGYGWQVAAAHSEHYIVDPGTNTDEGNETLAVQGWLSSAAATRILKASGYDLAELKKLAAAGPGLATRSLPQSALRMQALNQVTRGVSQNFCAQLRGHTYPDEYVMLAAHWDHFGSQTEGNLTKIFAGAIDNASGLAAILELARVFREQGGLPRSLVLCSFTAEEQGFLGAKHFLANPPFPLTALAGLVNLDCLNVGAKMDEVILYGRHEGQLAGLLESSAQALGRKVIADPVGEKGYFFRSDHYMFVKAGVPALLFLDIGFSDPSYLSERYHRPSDVYNPAWPLDGFVDDLALFADLVTRLQPATKL